jgi:DNA polymerase III epsilon subunit-like protein
MTIHAMLDLETMGKSPGCVVTHVAIVLFDPPNPTPLKTLHIHLSMTEQVKAGLTIDPSTIKWWLKQSNEAREIFKMDSYPISSLIDYIDSMIDRDTYVWSHATFDIPILNSLLQAFGYRSPINYKKCMDIRTAQELYRIKYKRDAIADKVGIAHRAVDDCKSQINLICKIIGDLKNEHSK